MDSAIDLYNIWSGQQPSQSADSRNTNTSNNINTSLSAQQQLSFSAVNSAYGNPPLSPYNNTTITSTAIDERNSNDMHTPSAILLQAKYRSQQQQQPPPPPATTTPQRVLNEREVFLIFVKVLFKCIERDPANGRLRQHAKCIVLDCTRRNRCGEANFMPLQDALERRLKGVVGDETWNQAKVYTGVYFQQNGIQTSVSV